MNILPPPAINPPGTKRRRVAVACERCHGSRVRCDAYWVGLPCSRCKGINPDSCRFIESKKRRGVNGRFVPNQPTQANESSPSSLTTFYSPSSIARSSRTTAPVPASRVSATQVDPRSPTQRSQASASSPGSSAQRLTRSPRFAVDLEKLCRVHAPDAESTSQPGRPNAKYTREPSPDIVLLDSTNHGQEGEPPETISHMGESWFLSFVLHNTNNEASSRHRPLGASSVPRETSVPPGDLSRSPTHATKTAEASSHTSLPEALNEDVCDQLLAAYFSYFQPLCPILDKEPFLDSVHRRTVSRTLLLSVCFIASVHCDMDILHSLGYQTRVEAGDDLFTKADQAVSNDTESDRITVMISSYLLHYWWGKPNKFNDSLWRLAGVIRSGQCLGMHHSTASSNMAADVRRRWKRLWWLLYIRDRQVSLCVGMPMIINDEDCTLEELALDDFPSEPRETAQYIIAQASLSRTACDVRRYISSIVVQHQQAPIAETEREIMQLLQAWYRNLPDEMLCHSRNASHLALTLQITFNLYRIVFFQRLHRAYQDRPKAPRSSPSIMDAAENVTSLTEQALTYFQPHCLPMICVTAIFAAMSVQYVASFSSRAYTSQIFLQKLRTNLLGLEQLEEVYSLASWIRRLFSKVLENPGSRRKSTTRQTTQNTSRGDSPSCVHEDASRFTATRAFASHIASNPEPHLPHLPTTAHGPSESVLTSMDGAGTTMSVSMAATEETFSTYPPSNFQDDLLLTSIWSDDPGDLAELQGQYLATNTPLNWPLLSPLEHENMRLLGLGAEFPYSY